VVQHLGLRLQVAQNQEEALLARRGFDALLQRFDGFAAAICGRFQLNANRPSAALHRRLR